MGIQTALSCPLGSKCEEVRDSTIHRCAWFVTLAGKNPSTGDTVDERGCAMSWMPVLLIENSQQQRATSAAVESFRNEMVQASDRAVQTAISIGRLQMIAALPVAPSPALDVADAAPASPIQPV